MSYQKKGEKGQKNVCVEPPEFIQERLNLFMKLKQEAEAELANKPQTPIKVTLPDGKEVEATAFKTTAYDVAKGIR